MKKRIFSLILALAMLCTLLPQVALPASAETYSGSCGDGLLWIFDTETGLLTITGSGAMEDYDFFTPAPWYDFHESITDVSLPEGLISIGSSAFGECSSLTSVNIPNSVRIIRNRAFNSCSSLTDVTIPYSVISIGDAPFTNCRALTAINVAPDNLYYSSVNGVLFDKQQTRLIRYPEGKTEASYQIPSGIVSIDYAAFYNSSLTNVSIPDSVTGIGSWAFENCSELNSVSIPNSVIGIGQSAFYGCSTLTSVSIGNGVTSIGVWAFLGCSALTDVTIPYSVTSIGEMAFGYYFDSESDSYQTYDGFTICGYEGTAAQNYAEENEFVFTSLGEVPPITGFCGAEGDGCNLTWTLNYYTGLLTIEGSGAMADFGERSPWYSYREYITTIVLPDGLTRIGSWAFRKCSGLTDVTIPDSVTSIGAYAFIYCDALTNISIPDSVTTIGWSAFSFCRSLISVNIPNGLTSIGEGMFEGCNSLTSVVIPDNVTSIDYSAFYGCSSLTSMTIPDSVTSIGYRAFSFCSSLTSLKIGNGVTNISGETFYNCVSLTSVMIPASVTSIGSMAFGYIEGSEGAVLMEGFTICGYPGTAAETYATENGFRFVAADRFADVNGSDYFFNPVMWAISQEPVITSGVDDTHFGPHNDCTREQIVTFLWAANGKPAPAGTGSSFSDVPADAWYYKPVMWAVENEITKGMEDGSFGVGQPCTRAQIITFLYKAYN